MTSKKNTQTDKRQEVHSSENKIQSTERQAKESKMIKKSGDEAEKRLEKYLK